MSERWNDETEERLVELLAEGVHDYDISDILNKEYPGRNYSRGIVQQRRRKLGLPPVGKQDLSFDDRVKIEKESVRDARDARALRAEVRQQARAELLAEAIRESVSPLAWTPPKYIKPKRKRKHSPEQAVLLLSDHHYGKKTDTYSPSVAIDRFEQVTDAVISIIDIHRNAYDIDVLHIILNGDIVDGDSIYPTHAHHIEQHVVDQVFETAPHIVRQLCRLAGFFSEIQIHCVRGNHGRVSKFAHEESNWDKVFYRVLATATSEIENIDWDIPANSWHNIFTVFNTEILHVHGHQIRMTLNLPWYGITTKISRWASTEQVKKFDIVNISHFHTSSCLQWGSKIIFTNGTLVSGDEFALEFLGLESSECQWLYGIHGAKGTTWRYEIRYN